VDSLDHPTAGANCAAVPYSEAPNIVVYSLAADQDCDGLVDGVERAWGSNPLLDDSDADGAKDFVEIFQQTNPLNPDTDGDGFNDAPVPTYTNSNTAYDNCPGSPNADQANNDGLRRDNGTIINAYASNPNQDKQGDACDPDDYNDALPDTFELSLVYKNASGQIVPKLASNPNTLDSDGDTINDGAEIINGKDAMASGNYPTWTDATNQLYYRGCHLNMPAAGSYGPYTNWDEEYDTAPPNPPGGDNIEMDIDGDGIQCGAGGDNDSDNGFGAGGARTAGPVGFSDKVEAFRYAVGIGNNDTDGDTCPDWVEITDFDGNRSANINDVYIVAAWMAAGPFNVEKRLCDLDANLSVNINDVYAAAANSSVGRSGATCTGGES